MNILIIDEEFPFPLNTGKRIRSFHLARALTKWHKVSYLAYGTENSAALLFMKQNEIAPYAVAPSDRRKSGLKFYLRLFVNLFSSEPYIVTSHYTARYQNRLGEITKSLNFDCIVCEWTPYAKYIRSIEGPKKIIVAHNVESSIWRGYEANERNIFKKAFISIQAARVENFERDCFKWAQGAIAVTEEDAGKIRGFGLDHEVAVIENGVDLDYFRPQAQEIDKNLMVFTGSMDWRPNQDAARYFVTEIFPRIRAKRPQAKVHFVGRDPDRKTSELGKVDGVTIMGTVDDVRPYIARAGAYIVPLRIGGGSRLKILEAMAMRKAIVSTSIGAEGLRVTDRENIVLSDDPEDFAREVLAVLDDDGYRGRLAESGMRTVEKYYRWEELGKKFSDYLCSVIRRD